MKYTVKIVVLILMLALCVSPMSVMAKTTRETGRYGDTPYAFYFRNTVDSPIHPDHAKKRDNETNWYLTIDNTSGSTLSSTNIFGVRMNRIQTINGKESHTFASGYHTFSNYVHNYKIPYIYHVEANMEMGLGAKKDDRSTSTRDLSVSGMFCP